MFGSLFPIKFLPDLAKDEAELPTLERALIGVIEEANVLCKALNQRQSLSAEDLDNLTQKLELARSEVREEAPLPAVAVQSDSPKKQEKRRRKPTLRRTIVVQRLAGSNEMKIGFSDPSAEKVARRLLENGASPRTVAYKLTIPEEQAHQIRDQIIAEAEPQPEEELESRAAPVQIERQQVWL